MYRMVKRFTENEQPDCAELSKLLLLGAGLPPVIDGLGRDVWITEIGWSDGQLVIEIRTKDKDKK